MSIKSDRWIRRMAASQGMIEPFEPGQVRSDANGQKIVSFGTSSYGYDVRCADEFKIFTNINSSIVDPKAFDANSFVDVQADTCIIPPNSFALARTVEYFRIPRSVLTICLGKSTYARCFSADTRVALVDGRSLSLEAMARAAEAGERFFGYGIDALGKVIVTELQAPRLIGQDTLLEIELDNGRLIRATPDHEFVLRDGTLMAADKLSVGTSLMPLYRSLRGGYETTFQPLNGHMLATHRLAHDWNLRHGEYADEPGTHRHHLDHVRTNDAPWNIGRMEASAHLSMHDALAHGGGVDAAEHGAAVRHRPSRLRQDDERYTRYRAEQSRRARGFRDDPKHAQTRADMLQERSTRWTVDERERQRRRQAAFRANNGSAGEMAATRSRDTSSKAGEERRSKQTEHAGSIRRREAIDADAVRRALDRTGSLRGAARPPGVDRSWPGRLPAVIAALGERAASGKTLANHEITRIRTTPGSHDVYCLSAPETGNFALEAGVFVSNCGLIVNVTPLEPEWEGHVTLEFSNTTPLPARIYANEGVAQMLFFESDEVCETSYKDRGGKYQGQRGVTLPRT